MFHQLGHATALRDLGLTKTAFTPARTTEERIRKGGTAAGAIIGTGAGLLRARKHPGTLLKNVLGGLGIGTTIGWLPDIMTSGAEAIS
jgi:hypothetical protein